MKHAKRSAKKNVVMVRSRKVLPAVGILLSLLLMLLPLEGPIASVKMILSYVFIPQIRASHESVEYAASVWGNVHELLNTHQENIELKEQLSRMQLENAQARETMQENQRLNEALQLRAPHSWKGIWAKTAYREPSQWNSVVIDKGSEEGVLPRAAAIVYQEGQPVLAGVVLESNEHTAKVLLVRDEDFSAAVYISPSQEEALLSGAGPAELKLNYLPLLSKVQEGELVYTSASSSIFPAGILVGRVHAVERKENTSSSVSARVEPAAEGRIIRELFILVPSLGEN